MKKLIVIFLLSAPICALATDPHHDHQDNNSANVTNINNTTTISKRYNKVEGVALAIAASQHQFDFGTYKWQAAVGAGSYDGDNALSIGVGKRVNDSRMLINGSIGVESGKKGLGMGINWRF